MRVKDIMTTRVRTAAAAATLKETAAALTEHGVSGLPVVDETGHVVGVISEADIVAKEAGLALPDTFADEKTLARTVAEAMTAPPVTVHPQAPVCEAARLMTERSVKRLPVVEGDRLVGIVSRADLVRAFGRADSSIEAELRRLFRALWLRETDVRFHVASGYVALVGELETEGEARYVEAEVKRIPGVVAVVSRLTWRAARAAAGSAGGAARAPAGLAR
jgi:CBS domain-containing protein